MHRRAVFVVAVAALPPLAWMLHLAITYAIVPESCAAGTTFWLNSATAVGVALIVAAGVAATLAHWNGRLYDLVGLVRSRDLAASRPAAERAIPTLAALFVPYFLLLVIMAGLVFLVVDPCA
jgi:hypothetical protein